MWCSVLDNNGMTLIEVMVSMIIFTIVFSMAFSLMAFGTKSFGSQVENIEASANARYAMDYLTREIRKSEQVEIEDNVLTLNNLDVYKLDGGSITKNGKEIIPNIQELSLDIDGTKVDIEISVKNNNGIGFFKIASTIYLRR